MTKGANNGLGPRFNSNQYFSCHSQPDAGGSSPAKNPLPALAGLNGAKNTVPWFIAQNGPIREARFKESNGAADGSVHDLFVITGRNDAPSCNIAQFDFLPAGDPLTGQGGNSNIIFRIPTPVFGAGLIEAIPEERDETPGCLFNPTPNDTLNFTTTPASAANSNPAVISDIEAFANFMRMLAPPTPAPATPTTENGRAAFAKIGCVHCHTPSFTTGAMIASGSSTSPSAALSHQTANLYSDLLVHHMGKGLADGITQGAAGPDEFRTAPLWGVGQRVFFLHDGRTTNPCRRYQRSQEPWQRGK